MPEPVEVVVVGNAGVDTEVFLSSPDIDLSQDSQFTANRDVVGHAGGYASRGFARLGRRTRYFGALGNDAAGVMVRRALAGDGVLLDMVFTDPQGTARSVNLMTPDGRRRAFYDGRGHLDQRVPDGLAVLALANVRLAHVHLANWARGVMLPSIGTIAVDLQDMRDVRDPYRADFIDAADILFVSGAHLADPEAAVRALLARGRVAAVVVGMGRDGVLFAERGGGVRHQLAPPVDLPIVDSNGVGDSLAVGFLDAYVLDGLGIDESVLRGQLCARWCCSRIGSDGLIDRAALRALRAELDTRRG